MLVAAVGFDLGETLLTYADTPLSWASLYPDALARVATATAVELNDERYAFAAAILAQYNTRLNPRRNEVPAEAIFLEILRAWEIAPTRRLVNGAISAFFDFFQQRMQPYPEAAEVLSTLRSRDLRVGVLTDVPYGMPLSFVERDLTGAKLASLVDVLLTSVEVGRRKPDPAAFQALARKLDVAPHELWYVGNEEKDIAGALAAGATAVLVDRAGAAPSWGQHHTVRDLRELL
jgi:putative hydrolase of the HAD superfamily